MDLQANLKYLAFTMAALVAVNAGLRRWMDVDILHYESFTKDMVVARDAALTISGLYTLYCVFQNDF